MANLKLSEIQVGDRVRADDGYSCIDGGAVLTVQRDVDGAFYVICQHGRHYLDGKLSADGQKTIVGLERA